MKIYIFEAHMIYLVKNIFFKCCVSVAAMWRAPVLPDIRRVKNESLLPDWTYIQTLCTVLTLIRIAGSIYDSRNIEQV